MKRNLFIPVYNNEPKTYTQEEVDKLLLENKNKNKEQVEKTVKQLEELQNSAKITQEERDALASQITQLNESLLTKEELAKQELGKKEKEFKTLIEGTTKERDLWKSEYTREKTTNEILKSARTHKVLSDEILLDTLMPKTRLVEVFGPDKKTVVGYVPKIKFKDKSEKGEEIELDLTIDDCVKRMKELPERFGTLFGSEVTGGAGGTGSTAKPTSQSEFKKIVSDPKLYKANREQLLKQNA